MQTASTNICEWIGRSQGLSEFQRGTVIGGHLCNKSSREISSQLNIPQSTVSGIITKWKRSGRSRKRTERGQRMLRRRVRRCRQLSAESITTDLQTSCGLQISSRTVRRELHGMGFHGRQSKVHKDMDEWVRCGRTWLACTESWPQPDRTPLGWIRAETASQAFSSNISVWPHECASRRMVKNSHKHTPKPCLPRGVEAVIAAKGGLTSY